VPNINEQLIKVRGL